MTWKGTCISPAATAFYGTYRNPQSPAGARLLYIIVPVANEGARDVTALIQHLVCLYVQLCWKEKAHLSALAQIQTHTECDLAAVGGRASRCVWRQYAIRCSGRTEISSEPVKAITCIYMQYMGRRHCGN
ncbi:hypothetical protein XENTR_v10006403 [Xenopus tropicalis]|nr:hypothetical protein XENTR_v10006403 [Xenopus tropicalis]